MQREYTLDNLNCAGCAAKIEENFKNNPDYRNVSLDFARKSLYFDSDLAVDAAAVSREIEKVESGVIVREKNKLKNGDSHDHHDHAHDHDHGATPYIKWRIAIALVLLAIGIFALSGIAQKVVLLAAYLVIGYDILYRSFKRIMRLDWFDENFLMSIATLGAMAIGEMGEGVAVMIFYQIGEYFQGKAVDQSRRSIADKINLRVETVQVLRDNQYVTLNPEQVAVGDIMRIGPHEKLALDGVVHSGQSHMQTASITGESLPKFVEVGDDVLSGFVNGQDELHIKASARYSDSTVAKILALVERASANKARVERFITRFARYYTPVVVLLAALIALIPPLVTQSDFAPWIYRGLVFLVISCPCALVLSIPLGFFAGLGAAAKVGVIVKGGNYLEALGKAKAFVFDKTGTLTSGAFRIAHIEPTAAATKEQLLSAAVLCETRSQHPIAKALVKDAMITVDTSDIKAFSEVPGKGVVLMHGESQYLAGSAQLLQSHGLSIDDIEDGYTRVYVAKDSMYLGCIAMIDQPKAEAEQAIKQLRQQGAKRIALVSGDRQSVADTVAKNLEIDSAFGGCLPAEKLTIVERFKSESDKDNVVFIGDGSNDAPVLAGADIGIAMGGVGTDAAIEAADMMIMQDDLSALPKAVAISRKTMQIITQNIVFALSFKVFVMVLGIFGIASMWLAVFADVGVALLAVLNAMRILRVD